MNWTHEDLANELGIKAAGVSKILSQSTNSRIDTLVRWAKALGVSPQRLLGTEKPQAPPRSLDSLRIEAIALIAKARIEEVADVIQRLGGNLPPLRRRREAGGKRE